MIKQYFSLRMGHAVDTEALVYLQPLPGVDVIDIRGRLRGPQCEFARTLQAEVPLQKLSITENVAPLSQVLIPDPCYWTPQLPFQYELHVSWRNSKGEELEDKVVMGLRRWGIDGADWKLEQSRIVLRGAKVSDPHTETFAEARQAEVALLVEPLSDELFQLASNLGVPLIVDCRNTENQFSEDLARLSWTPSVLAVLASHEQLERSNELANRSIHPFLGLATGIGEASSEQSPQDFLVCEIDSSQQPPAWIKDCNKPTIVIRQNATEIELPNVRKACDQLQAELAPEFDLAGYFVTP